MSEADAAMANPQEQPETSKPRRGGKRRASAASDAPAGETPPQSIPPTGGGAGPQEGETEKTWVSKLPEPHGRDNIDLGDGRRLRFLRSNRWQQARIQFLAPEGDDPKPDAKYTRWLREHGWQWRSKEVAWTKQFAKNSDEDRYARSNSDLAMELQFIELANLIRTDKGLAEIQPVGESQRTPF